MPLAPLEVLMYAVVFAGNPAPTECNLRPDKSVHCTNGIQAVEDKKFGMILQDTKKNEHATFMGTSDGRIVFSNGLEGKMTATGWIKFSNGNQARRDLRGHADTFLISPGLVCSIVSETTAACKPR